MMRAPLVSLFALIVGTAVAHGAEPTRQELVQQAANINAEALQLYRSGKYAEAVQLFEKALEIRRRVFPIKDFPDGHPDLASGLNNLGALLEALGAVDRARPYLEEALTMRRKLFPKSKFPDGHPLIVVTLNNLGMLNMTAGRPENALPFFEEAVGICRRIWHVSAYPEGHTQLAGSLINLATVLKELGRYEAAFPISEQAMEMHRRLYPAKTHPNGNPELAASITGHAHLLHSMGRAESALPLYEQALAIKRKLFPPEQFPDGHPDLVLGIHNLASILKDINRFEDALNYQLQALKMYRTVYPAAKYPNGHPHVAMCLSNMGLLCEAVNDMERAVDYLKQSFEMMMKLYPTRQFPAGHPLLAGSLSRIGSTLFAIGDYDQARSYLERAVAMFERLNPNSNPSEGHFDLIHALSSLGIAADLAGKPQDGLRHCERAARLHHAILNRDLATAAESDVLERITSEPAVRDVYLTVARKLGNQAPNTYPMVWESKSALMRLLKRRHDAATAAGSQSEIRKCWDDLTQTRRAIGRLLADPTAGGPNRERHLLTLNERQGKLERQISSLLPAAQRDHRSPDELSAKLPAGTVLIDFVSYEFLTFSNEIRGKKGALQTRSYLAHVVVPGQAPKRVEVGKCDTIDAAILAWRREIEAGRDDRASAANVRRLVWDKLAPVIPPSTRTVFVSPDGDLARLSWAALPGSKPNSVLLEEFAGGIATIAHGTALLEALLAPAPTQLGGNLLLMGGVDYGRGRESQVTYSPLPATMTEMKQVAAAAGKLTHLELTGLNALPRNLIDELPKAQMAHLATHGYFDEAGLAAERGRIHQFLLSWKERGEAAQRVGLGTKSPLAFSGLAASGANQSVDGILTAESIVNLPLEKLRLCVLSACETGLGASTGAEGVYGLVRAFHIAGCPDVIASLWRVNDAATAALMAKFYHEMLVNKQSPLPALREAQLTIYRHPELIPDLAGERGAPKAKNALAVQSLAASPGKTHTKLWAAFVLSGSGR